ncbi:hypothetical protein NQZ68_020616 [Dissostichus eleginoides]|nr:hypothetical protein NQZ68_020616 [Dissostichus eleginoides]
MRLMTGLIGNEMRSTGASSVPLEKEKPLTFSQEALDKCFEPEIEDDVSEMEDNSDPDYEPDQQSTDQEAAPEGEAPEGDEP